MFDALYHLETTYNIWRVRLRRGRQSFLTKTPDRPQGTVDIRPLEPPKLLLALESPQGTYQRGYQEVTLPKMAGRYDDQLTELARVIRGEIESPYSSTHDLAVHETILRASGMPVT